MNTAHSSSIDLEIFPWDDRFKTGIEEIDDQHETLVALVNRVAQFTARGCSRTEMETVFDDLLDYTRFHFGAEEALWRSRITPSHQDVEGHLNAHHDFIDYFKQLRQELIEAKSFPAMDGVLEFLVQWLLKHILRSDRRLAYIVQSIDTGLTQEQAKTRADRRMAGTTHVIIDITLAAYSTLSKNTLHLMREMESKRDRVREIERLSQHNATIMQLAIDFISQPLDNMESAIEDALGKIALLFEADRAGLYEYDDNRNWVFERLSWSKDSDSQPPKRDVWLTEGLGDMVEAHENGKPWIHSDSTVDPPTGLNELLSQLHIQNLVSIPLTNRFQCIGFIVLGKTDAHIHPSEDEYQLLRLFTHLLANVYERQHFELQLERVAHFDSLTGLPNRMLLGDRLRQAMTQANRHGNLLAVVCLDLDNFKHINDRWGHQAGDRV
ncbi:hypothetical protein GCM10007392_37290 [Saccharospirillum salsuginis]|uniref:GGDEF domain-containing protein n=1 Tax=Saccharospirillum salsuginis TaxID=418750 RepID=A0A918NGV9_9GAMM|nr:hypothetical protein GCM10007392_37290 [Saccharospirillum salsuginis]